MEGVKLTEMPSHEVLQEYLAQIVLGKEVRVYFDYEQGVFVDVRSIDTNTGA